LETRRVVLRKYTFPTSDNAQGNNFQETL